MFVGEKVTLRQLELEDIDEIMKHWNNYEFRQNTGRATPNSREEMLDFIKNSWKLKQEKKGYFFAIVEKKTNQYLGHCSLTILNRTAKSSDLGIFIYAKKNWNKGFGTDAMKLLLNFGFKYLNLHRIELGVYPSNERAVYVYKKLGFKEVGRQREKRYMGGEYRDELLMDILKREWLENSNEK